MELAFKVLIVDTSIYFSFIYLRNTFAYSVLEIVKPQFWGLLFLALHGNRDLFWPMDTSQASQKNFGEFGLKELAKSKKNISREIWFTLGSFLNSFLLLQNCFFLKNLPKHMSSIQIIFETSCSSFSCNWYYISYHMIWNSYFANSIFQYIPFQEVACEFLYIKLPLLFYVFCSRLTFCNFCPVSWWLLKFWIVLKKYRATLVKFFNLTL